ncbi:flagellin N-terminal helical domain-containing protein [Dysosmobacter sp.]|uniref:flagellin N-terminal helical domain-containing protein n=1 Tax=Dysosmobacter sp. TaxID=2591382 RepID=UPI002A99EC0F|nr:flagellin [Dysosmobacter sp.]MDY5509306.1 flagellin [Dysosmobacter sp.]
MRIQHNIMAMNAYRNYNNNTSALSKNLEKLSSGYKINRAGDDAAGLAISEKMRAQITGLDAATKNVKDGISLVKTGEGAMQEIHDMLNRMDYLATQSANGTYDNEVDRANLQKEVESLRSEIDRIADSANFNGIKLLDGSLGGKGNLGGDIAVEVSKVTTSVTKSSAFASASAATQSKDTFDFTVAWKDSSGKGYSTTVTLTAKNTTTWVAKDGTEYTTASATAKQAEIEKMVLGELQKDSTLTSAFDVEIGADHKLSFTSKESGASGAQITALGATGTGKVATKLATDGGAISNADTVVGQDAMQILDFTEVKVIKGSAASGTKVPTAEDLQAATFEVDGKKFLLAGKTAVDANLKNLDPDVTVIKLAADTYSLDNDAANVAAVIGRTTGMEFEVAAATDAGAGITKGDIIYKGDQTLSKDGKALTLQIGDTSDQFNQLDVKVADMHADALGIGDINISTQEGAAAAINKIKEAINSVSSTRGDLGAIQNRLEHTQNNLSVMKENIQDAESTIRDTDVADEMMAYTKNNILIQSAQAMLAQANQVPQGVLQLLQ